MKCQITFFQHMGGRGYVALGWRAELLASAAAF